MLKDVKMVLFLISMSVICVLILSFGQNLYLEMADTGIFAEYKGVLTAFDIKYDDKDFKDVFADNFKTVNSGGKRYYISLKGNKGSISVVEEGPGLWSVIRLLVVIDKNRDSLISIHVLSHGETPGLGGRIEEKEYLDKFKNVSVRPSVLLVKKAKKENEVDALSGATATSKGVEDILNKAISELDSNYMEEFDVP